MGGERHMKRSYPWVGGSMRHWGRRGSANQGDWWSGERVLLNLDHFTEGQGCMFLNLKGDGLSTRLKTALEAGEGFRRDHQEKSSCINTFLNSASKIHWWMYVEIWGMCFMTRSYWTDSKTQIMESGSASLSTWTKSLFEFWGVFKLSKSFLSLILTPYFISNQCIDVLEAIEAYELRVACMMGNILVNIDSFSVGKHVLV